MAVAIILAFTLFIGAYAAAYALWSEQIVPFLREHDATPSRFPHGGINYINQVIDGEKARDIAKTEGRCPWLFRLHGWLLLAQFLVFVAYPLFKCVEAMCVVFGD